MDAPHFDHLSKSLARLAGRRPLARVLATLPLVGAGGLLAGETAARRKRRGGAQAEKKKAKKKPFCLNGQAVSATKKKAKKLRKQGATPGKCPGCIPDARSATCNEKCGSVVNNCEQTVDCGVCGCLPVTTTSALQAAIDAVAPGETLTLCAGTWNITATVTVSDDMTLRGAGVGQTILDGNDAVRVLWIDDANAAVELEDLTIRKGLAFGADNRGGGIRNDGTLEMRRVVVSECEALHGGGVANFGTLNMFDGAVIRENTATDSGGGLDAWQDSVTTMHDGSRISNNTAPHGGGIQLFGCQLTLGSGSRISGNEGTSDVGGIYASSSTIILQDGSVVGGTAPEDANKGNALSGGISIGYGTLTLESGSRVIGNTATLSAGIGASYSTVNVRSGARVTGNVAGSDGGGIRAYTGSVTVEAGALVCDNLPLNAQCAGTISGACPAPGQVCQV
ncbi:MAG: hypothetical protein R2853_01455 [Thermomicrobiales bacterium]